MIDLLVRVGEVAFALTMIFGLVGMASRFKPVRWLWHQLVLDPISEHRRKEIAEVVAPIVTTALTPVLEEIRQINDAVNNSKPGTPKIKDRVENIEAKLEAQDEVLSAQDEVLAQLRVGQHAAAWDRGVDDVTGES